MTTTPRTLHPPVLPHRRCWVCRDLVQLRDLDALGICAYCRLRAAGLVR